ncbi:hypothetical protein [Methanococcus voltae]|uniref:Uncharacterized protein n=2 Tax=Methanococcus voltae TaxID=2188 RepID=A0A8J7S383_METVO|nr:hypothetical protein [Methanococcus voltae]MBP2172431.1 hypothetical protein [Methanococcus voltae]MBP2200613.1 hypothetical protein [Methanococcus voltae]MCS3921338.1 hypothetical protein [Methanococcus voltae PS]
MLPLIAINILISLFMGYNSNVMSFKKIPLVILINGIIYYIAYVALNNFNNLYINLQGVDIGLIIEIILISYMGYYLGAYTKLFIKKDRYSR